MWASRELPGLVAWGGGAWPTGFRLHLKPSQTLLYRSGVTARNSHKRYGFRPIILAIFTLFRPERPRVRRIFASFAEKGGAMAQEWPADGAGRTGRAGSTSALAGGDGHAPGRRLGVFQFFSVLVASSRC